AEPCVPHSRRLGARNASPREGGAIQWELQNSATSVVFCNQILIRSRPLNVSSPISSIIPSLDGAVLGALAGTTRPLNLSTVHELAGRGSLSGVRRVLLRLVKTGIVSDVPGGYILNRE